MKIAWNKIYSHPLPEGHKFPMEKYSLIPQILLEDQIIKPNDIIDPQEITKENILLTHSEEYLNRLESLSLNKKEVRKMGFPLSAELIKREKMIGQGTLDLAYYSLRNNNAGLNVAGGTHHAFRDLPEGFCLLNDLAMAANVLLNENLVRKILIIDLDVHQGNGTAKLFENDNRVFTFSMHAEDNYPLEKQKSDLDIGLSHNISDSEYLELVESNTIRLLKNEKPDIVFYQCGVDILETDKFGRINISPSACNKRDDIVIENVWKENLPLVCTMGGGYSPNIMDIVNAHLYTFRKVKEIFG